MFGLVIERYLKLPIKLLNRVGSIIFPCPSLVNFRFTAVSVSTAFTWMSKKQSIVALSTCEAEYVASSTSIYEAIWLKNLLKEFDHSQEEPIIIYVDNKSAIKHSKNPIQHGRSKHIDMKYHFLRDYVKQKVVKL